MAAMKPKWKETEFWVLVLGMAVTLLTFLLDYVSGNVAVVVEGLLAGVYTVYRQLAKRKPTDEQLRNAVFGAFLESERLRRRGNNGGIGGVHSTAPASGPGSADAGAPG